MQSKINYDPRKPYFCAGCPHNSSTVIPEGSRAYAGIGCHYMVQWMDRSTIGYTHMGGEGANWIGEAQFSKRNQPNLSKTVLEIHKKLLWVLY